jgi:pentatricopeptide repeat protein
MNRCRWSKPRLDQALAIQIQPAFGKLAYSTATVSKPMEMDLLKKHDSELPNLSKSMLVTFLSKRGSVHEARDQVLRILEDGSMPTNGVISQYFSACFSANDAVHALEIYNILFPRLRALRRPLSKRFQKTITYVCSMMINLIGKNTEPLDMNQVWAIYEDMKQLNIPLNTVLYNTLLRILLERQEHSQVHTVYGEMLEKGHTPTLHTYSMLMLSMAKQGDMDGFTKLLDVMQSRDMYPDFIGWCVIMNAVGRHGNSSGVDQIYEYLRSTEIPVTSWMINEKLHSLLCRKINANMNHSKRMHRLEVLWEGEFGAPLLTTEANAFTTIQPDAVSYTIMMKAMLYDAPARALQDIPKVLDIMESRGLQPGYQALIHYVGACINERNTAHAKYAIVRFQEKYNITPDEKMWRRIIGAMASENNISGLVWALDALTGSNYVTRKATIDFAIPRKRPARYRYDIKEDAIKQLLPPTTFLNNVFGPKTLALVFNALLQSDTPAHTLNQPTAELVIYAWNTLHNVGVYIPKKIEQTIVIPGLVAKGLLIHDIGEKLTRHQ